MSIDNQESVPGGYAETLDCLNQPVKWNCPAMIADMAEYLRQGIDVPPGQLLAAIDWMAWRLGECKQVISDANITAESESLLKKLKGF